MNSKVENLFSIQVAMFSTNGIACNSITSCFPYLHLEVGDPQGNFLDAECVPRQKLQLSSID